MTGKAIIFITHKLHEVLEICDRINVLRRGKIVGEEYPKKTDKKKLAELMVGRTVNLRTSRKKMEQGEVLLEVNDLSILSDNKEYVLSNVDLKLHKNEILGIAGVQGNGQTELIEALTGLRSVSSGKISYFGKEYKNFSPRKIHQLGVQFYSSIFHS